MNILEEVGFDRRLPPYDRLWDGAMFTEWHGLQWNFDKLRVGTWAHYWLRSIGYRASD